METISKYARGGGSAQIAYIRSARAIYKQMLKDPHQHQMDGFGLWEFLGLLGVILQGDAREMHTAFMEQ